MAEVLITLAIIGVVAALTIPTLISNYQKNQYVTQLKKNYSIISNAARNLMAQEGVMKFSDTSYANAKTDAEYQAALSKMFKISKFYPKKTFDKDPLSDPIKCHNKKAYCYMGSKLIGAELNLPTRMTVLLTDGTIIYFYRWKNTEYKAHVEVEDGEFYISEGDPFPVLDDLYIDVNGIKGPNILGRDLFQIYLGQDGTLLSAGGTAFWHYKASGLASSYSCNGKSKTSQGDGCVQKIIDEGWKMTY